MIASCLFLVPILTFFLRNNDLFICGHPNQDVGGELILDCKIEDLEVLHEYFRPRGCIKYCLLVGQNTGPFSKSERADGAQRK